MSKQRVAVLVDGDNLGSKHSEQILSEAAKLGRVDVSRLYISAHQPSEWFTTPGFRIMHAGSAKNAADVLLCIDAMELALERGIEAFVIVSSDRDFTHLAQRLRERGAFVLGIGKEKAPEEFRAACSRFHDLGPPPGASKPPRKACLATDFDQQIKNMIARHSQGGRGMLIAQLAPKMHADHGTRISTLPERTWRAYLSKRSDLYEVDPRGPEAMVRFLPAGFGPA